MKKIIYFIFSLTLINSSLTIICNNTETIIEDHSKIETSLEADIEEVKSNSIQEDEFVEKLEEIQKEQEQINEQISETKDDIENTDDKEAHQDNGNGKNSENNNNNKKCKSNIKIGLLSFAIGIGAGILGSIGLLLH